MQMLVVLDIDVDEQEWRTRYGERTAVDVEIAEHVYRLVAFSERMTACAADVRLK